MKLLFFIIIGLLVSFTIVSANDFIYSFFQEEYSFLVKENITIPILLQHNYSDNIRINYIAEIREIGKYGNYSSKKISKVDNILLIPNKTGYNLRLGNFNHSSMFEVNFTFMHTGSPYSKELYIYIVENATYYNENIILNTNFTTPSNSMILYPEYEKTSLRVLSKSRLESNVFRQLVQDNQLQMDTEVIKKSIEVKNNQKITFESLVNDSEEIKEKHLKLILEGYSRKISVYLPEQNESGSFEFTYESVDGKKLILYGEMKNGKIVIMEQLEEGNEKYLLKIFQKNETYKECDKEFVGKNFHKTTDDFDRDNQILLIKTNYINDNKKKAYIEGKFIRNSLKEVYCDKAGFNYEFIFWVISFVLVLAIFLYSYKKIKNPRTDLPIEKIIPDKDIINRDGEISKMFKEAEQHFLDKKYRSAYRKISQAVRMHFIWKKGLKKAITKRELFNHLKVEEKELERVKKCLNFCDYIGFSSYKTKKENFEKILTLAKNITQVN